MQKWADSKVTKDVKNKKSEQTNANFGLHLAPIPGRNHFSSSNAHMFSYTIKVDCGGLKCDAMNGKAIPKTLAAVSSMSSIIASA